MVYNSPLSRSEEIRDIGSILDSHKTEILLAVGGNVVGGLHGYLKELDVDWHRYIHYRWVTCCRIPAGLVGQSRAGRQAGIGTQPCGQWLLMCTATYIVYISSSLAATLDHLLSILGGR
jgi:hypothetical protein